MRARPCTTRRASGSSTSSPRATRWRGPSRRGWRERRPVGAARHARGRPSALPQRGGARCAAPASTRRRELVPGLPRRALPMGGIATDLEGALDCARPLRRRRVRLHRPARREPTRLQLAVGVLRVRPPGRARRARRSADAARTGATLDDVAAPPAQPSAANARRRCGGCAGLERDAAGLRELADDPHPLARLIAACALHREESRGAHRRSDFPRLDPALRPPPRGRPPRRGTESERWGDGG